MHLIAFLFSSIFISSFCVQAKVTLTLYAAGPDTYDHAVGGGAVNDGTIGRNKDVVTSLEGKDFRCGDYVTHFLVIVTDAVPPINRCVVAELGFTADSTGQSGVAYGDVPYFHIQFNNFSVENGASSCTQQCVDPTKQTLYCPPSCANCDGVGFGNYKPDCAYGGNGDETAAYVDGSKYFTFPMHSSNKADMRFKIRACGLDAFESVVLRFDAEIYCRPDSTPTGLIQAALYDATEGDGTTAISTGKQTVPVNGVDDITGSQGCTPITYNPISAADFNATVSVFKPEQLGGSYDMFIWYSWSRGAYRLQTFGTVNFTEVHTFDVECSFLHDGTVMYTQATCGCQATFIDNSQPQLFFSTNSTYYQTPPTAENLVQFGTTYAVWHYRRATNESSVTDLYILRSNNATILRADFYTGEYWLFRNYQQGDQAASNFQLASSTSTTQCQCKKQIDLMVVLEQSKKVTAGNWNDVVTFVGTRLVSYTSTCGTTSTSPFGFFDPNNSTNCLPGVNYGVVSYDQTPVVRLSFSGGTRGTNPSQVFGATGSIACPAGTNLRAGDACGNFDGNISAAIIAGVNNLLTSSRTSAAKALLIVTRGINTATRASVSAAVAYAVANNVQVFAVAYFSTEFISDMQIMVSDPDNFIYKSFSSDLVTVNAYWPITIMAKICTPSALPCGSTCCGQCEPTCGTCLTTPLNCPTSTNCSVRIYNNAYGCCITEIDNYCPAFQAGQCTNSPVCNAATGNCSYTPSCVANGDTCYSYNCIVNATNPSGPGICVKTPLFFSDLCTIRTCVSGVIVSTPNPNACPASDACYDRTCNTATLKCDITRPLSTPAWFNESNQCHICTPATGFTTKTCSTTDRCATSTCNPNTGLCDVRAKQCPSDRGACDSPFCDPATGNCGHRYTNCTSNSTDPCKVCPDSNSNLCCNPSNGQCGGYVDKSCTASVPCPCGSPFQTCTAGVCSCPDACSPTMAPPTGSTPPPTATCPTCPFNRCSSSTCNASTGSCTTAVEPDCTQWAVDNGYNLACVIPGCDVSIGCFVTSNQTCTGDFCTDSVVGEDGCCVTVPKNPCVDTGCFSYTCDVASSSCLETPLCDPGTDRCINPFCDDTQTCSTNPVVCEIADTTCLTWLCNSSTGECDSTQNPCDDGDLCTFDYCDAVNDVCVNDPIPCSSSGDLCVTTPVCDPATGTCVSTNVDCDDGVVCTTDSCDSATGCINEVNDVSCETDNPCVTNSVCTPTGCSSEFVDCGGAGLFCSTHYCEDYFGCTAQPTNCAANSTNETCSISNCSEVLKACETIEQPCLAFLGIVAGLVVAGVVVGAVAAAIILVGAAAGGGAAAVSQNSGHDQGHHVNVNPLFIAGTKTGQVVG